MVDAVPPSREAARESESGAASPEQALTESTPVRNANQMAKKVEVSRSFLPTADLGTWSDAHFHPRRRMASHLGAPRNSCAQLGKVTERGRTVQWANLQTGDLIIAY